MKFPINKNTSSNPFEKLFFGSLNLITTKNGNTIAEVNIDLTELQKVLEDEEGFKAMLGHSGYQTKHGSIICKLKGIPLRAPQDNKTHFLVMDYFKPERQEPEEAKGKNTDDLPF